MTKIRELIQWNRPSSIFVRKGESIGSAIAAVQEDMNRTLERFYDGLQVRLTNWDDKAPAAPSVNVTETADAYMEEAGLANNPTEWWHFGYGELMWARLKDQKTAFYGAVEP